MTTYVSGAPQPPRRDLTDPRSSAGPRAPQSGKPLLNDRRSTRGRRRAFGAG